MPFGLSCRIDLVQFHIEAGLNWKSSSSNTDMSSALSLSFLPGLSSVFSLACQHSLESCGSSANGTKSQSPPPVPASDNASPLLFGHHTYQAVGVDI